MAVSSSWQLGESVAVAVVVVAVGFDPPYLVSRGRGRCGCVVSLMSRFCGDVPCRLAPTPTCIALSV